MENNKNVVDELLKGVQYLIKEEIKKSPIDKTITGVINKVKENNLYDVLIGKTIYNNVPSVFIGLKINDSVKIKIPQNQYSQMYIEGKYNIKIESSGGGTSDFNIGSGLKLDSITNTLSVDTTNNVEQDNTKPITSAGVYTVVGNIDELLKTI